MRKRLVADGAEDALTSAAELHENEDADTESVQRRRQAAKLALEALHGKLDVQSLPGKGHAQRTLKQQLSTLVTDYSKWDDGQLLSIPRYNTFISHKRSSAQDFARGLHSLIVHHGHSCFIDVENLESLSDLPMVVAGCDVFILVSCAADRMHWDLIGSLPQMHVHSHGSLSYARTYPAPRRS